MGKQPCRTVVATKTNLGIGGAELSLVRADAQIAGQANTQARPHSKPVDRGDRNLGNVVEQPGELLHLPQTINVLLMRLFGGLRHGAHVTTGAESPARSGYDAGSDVQILAPVTNGIERVAHQLTIQSV